MDIQQLIVKSTPYVILIALIISTIFFARVLKINKDQKALNKAENEASEDLEKRIRKL